MNPIASASDYNVVSFINDGDDEDSTTKTYFCNFCNSKLNYQSTDEETGKNVFWCSKCSVSFIPANQLVKSASKFGPNKEPLTASVDPVKNNGVSSTAYISKQNLPPLFDALKRRGFHFKHYEQH